MLRTSSRLGAGLLLSALFVGAPLTAQEAGGPPQLQMPDSVRDLMTELQQAQKTLDSIQTQAMESNPELRAQRQELQETVQQAMMEMHPELEGRMQRMQEIQGEIEQAQQSQNQQKVQELVVEVRGIRQQMQSAQAEAMQKEDVSQAIEDFRTELIAAMKEVDPAVEAKLDRLDELAQRIRAIQSGGDGGSGDGSG